MNEAELNRLLNIVAFSILMQNNEGIEAKSPGYIEEKFRRYLTKPDQPNWQSGLDKDNQEIFKNWAKRWNTPKWNTPKTEVE